MDHMRRMHQHVETQSTAAARASQTRAARVGQRRYSVKREAKGEDNE